MKIIYGILPFLIIAVTCWAWGLDTEFYKAKYRIHEYIIAASVIWGISIIVCWSVFFEKKRNKKT